MAANCQPPVMPTWQLIYYVGSTGVRRMADVADWKIVNKQYLDSGIVEWGSACRENQGGNP